LFITKLFELGSGDGFTSSPPSRTETPPPSASPERAWARIRTPSPEITYDYAGGDGAYMRPFSQPGQPVLSNLMPFTPPTPIATPPISPIFSPHSSFYSQKAQPGGNMALNVLEVRTVKCTEQWSTEEEVATPRLRPMADTMMPQEPLGHPYQCTPKEHPSGKMALNALQARTAKSKEQWSMEEQMAGPIVSQGSLGHPYQCAPACKYATKKRGGICKDGAACSRCHLCVWQQHGGRRKQYAGHLLPRSE